MDKQLKVKRDKIYIVPKKSKKNLKKKVACDKAKRTRSPSENSDIEARPKKKMSKFDRFRDTGLSKSHKNWYATPC